jgi:predicted nucleic acid-binding protein
LIVGSGPRGVSGLDRGERAAILLACEFSGAALLIDDAEARQVATAHGIVCTGTLGILRDAATIGLVDLRQCLDSLMKTNFRVSRSMVEQTIADYERQRDRR